MLSSSLAIHRALRADLIESVLVVTAPPLIGWGLRPALRRIFPVLLPPEGCQIEECPEAAQRFVSARGSEVGAKDIVAVAQKDTRAGLFTFVCSDTKVLIEVTFRGR